MRNLILIALFLIANVGVAKGRFQEADQKVFMDEVRQEIAEHKIENNGQVDLNIIKAGFFKELDETFAEEKITRDELNRIKKAYERLAADSNIASDKKEESFYTFLADEFKTLSSASLEKVKEGAVCNLLACEAGLKCAKDPAQKEIAAGKKRGLECNEGKECASGECHAERVGAKKKICEDVFRCFRPLALGESCIKNPVCSVGFCLPFDAMTAGIGECQASGKTCKNNSDCCSNSCNGGICRDNFTCKDCVRNGAKPIRGQKCCEGLYKNENGICVPAIPPSVIQEVKLEKRNFKNILFSLMLNIFLPNAQAAGEEMKSVIMGEKAKYQNFVPTSKVGETLNMEKGQAKLNFSRKSDFETCDIRFKDDFYNSLKADGSFDLEVAMLAFDFVSTGESDNDYWRKSSSEDSSIFGRLKQTGLGHREIRKSTNLQVDAINKKLTCACLDVQGLDKITDAGKKEFFEKECPEYAKYIDPNTSPDQLNGDASGLKAKRLLVLWVSNLNAFNASLAINNNAAYTQLLAVSNWVNETNWNQATERNYDLFKFTIEKSKGSAVGAIAGALLAAGVLAVLGGFATTSILSAWAAAGIITASAVTGSAGMWMFSTLKGAWITKHPEISDYETQPRTYACGKKSSCTDYTRTLVQPYNNICNVHTSANACLKSFLVVSENGESRYIVDPWVPAGVSKSALLRGQPNYVEKMEQGFQAAKAAMMGRNPGANYVTDNYLSDVFIDESLVGQYAPAIGQNIDAINFLDEARIKMIKEAAMNFAVSENFLEAGDKENLKIFADYAYEYHFLWPKKSRLDEISYPTVGLSTYLNYMSKEVAGNLSVSGAKSAIKLSRLEELYRADLAKNLALYDQSLNHVDKLLKGEIDQNAQALKSLSLLNSLFESPNLDQQLKNLNNGNVGGTTSAGDLSKEQLSFLNAVGNLRSTRKAQVKALDNFKKEVAKNSENSGSAGKVASVAQKFSEKFAKGNAAFNGFLVTGTNEKSGFGTNKNSEKGNGEKENNFNVASINGTGALYGPGGIVNSRGSSRNGNGSGENGSGNGYGNGAEGSVGNTNKSDAEKLAEAVQARDDQGRTKYESNDLQTLFEKITNAYIRNYDKILTKKKGKDAVEEKE